MPNIIRMRVFDRPGVLDRITGLIRRHGVNIRTITCGNVSDGISEITMSLGGPMNLDFLGGRFSEMNSVREWETCTEETHILRELLLARFRDGQMHLLDDDMRVIKQDDGVVFAEYVGGPTEVERKLEQLREAGVSCARGGTLGLALVEGGAS